ncbi:MAG TPA: OmpH family outer membrane protein [Rhizomicrobium sp.]
MNIRTLTRRSAGAAAALALATLGGLALSQNTLHAAPVPGAHTLIVNKQAVMNGSRLGQDIRRQVMGYEHQVESQFGPQGQALQAEGQTLQQQAPTLAPDVRNKKIQAFETKENAYRQKVQAKQSLIQGGELVARQRYLAAVGAVIHAIMIERGAELVLDKSSVADSVSGIDITPAVIQRLDKKITSLKVPLVNPPAGAISPAQ